MSTHALQIGTLAAQNDLDFFILILDHCSMQHSFPETATQVFTSFQRHGNLLCFDITSMDMESHSRGR
jgi:hypothetical protein